MIGCWGFTEIKEAERTSYRRKKGTLETVGIQSITNVEHERMLIDNVIPAIKAKFPSRNRTIYIQMDNAKPHTIRVDKLIEEECKKDGDGWDIRIKRQPPNSPDFNVLDLVSDNRFGGMLIVISIRFSCSMVACKFINLLLSI